MAETTKTIGQLIAEKNERIAMEDLAKEKEKRRILKEKMAALANEKMREALQSKNATPRIRIAFVHSNEELAVINEVLHENAAEYAPFRRGNDVTHTPGCNCGGSWGGCDAGKDGGTEVWLEERLTWGGSWDAVQKRNREEETEMVTAKRPK